MSSKSGKAKTKKRKSRIQPAILRFTIARTPKNAAPKGPYKLDRAAQERFFEFLVDEAKNGDPDKVHSVLEWYCDYHDQRKPIPRAILQFIRDAFCEYLDEDVHIEKALRLVRPKHRPKGTHTAKPEVLAATYHLMVKQGKVKKTEVKAIVANECHTTSRNVEAAVKNETIVKSMSKAELEALLLPDE